MPGELAGEVYEEGNQGYRVRRSGLDAVEFLLAAGPAEQLRPLGAIASGGESARVMFALKAAPALALAAASGGDNQNASQEGAVGRDLQSQGMHNGSAPSQLTAQLQVLGLCIRWRLLEMGSCWS